MIAKRVPWTAVEPYSIVGADDGDTAVTMPVPDIRMVRLLHRDGSMCDYQRPGGFATVLEPEIGDAVGNLMQHFTFEQIEDTE